MTQITLERLIEMIGLLGMFSSTVGGGTALLVDFYRRRVRSKAAEYAAASDFSRITNAVNLLQSTLERHMDKTTQNHYEVCQRVAHLEGRYDAKPE
jgi:hypothetical protein